MLILMHTKNIKGFYKYYITRYNMVFYTVKFRPKTTKYIFGFSGKDKKKKKCLLQKCVFIISVKNKKQKTQLFLMKAKSDQNQQSDLV